MSPSILVVDDEPAMQDVLGQVLRAEGYQVATAGSGEEALERIGGQEFDVIVTDMIMPGLSGLDVLERSRSLNPCVAVILITGYATVETAIAALRKGASDYLQKPFSLDDLTRRITQVMEYRGARQDVHLCHRVSHQRRIGEDLVGQSEAIQAVRHQIGRCAPAPTNVLITGESGVGKELVARAIHAASPRSDHPFVPVNCGAIPEALLESQLFGHVKGAFTSAVRANPGLFTVAHPGTLFLDEIGELPFALQVKLLRVIEDKQVWPVGATRSIPIDVRIIASTNRDLVRETEAGRFREDLFYRLNVVHITLPPLRERRGDILLLVDHFVQRLNLKLGTRFVGVERDALHALANHAWKGNVRELENVLERAMILGEGDVIRASHLSADVAASSSRARPTDLRDAVRQFERRHILDVIEQSRLDKRDAARLLGISLASLYRKLDVGPDPAFAEK